jgi:RNA polymerase sigma-70 factor, ECF subfamily
MMSNPPQHQRPKAAGHLTGEQIDTLHRLHRSALYRAMLNVTGHDPGRAEDIVQEVMLRAWRHPELLERGLQNARPWLFTVGRRIAIDQLRALTSRPSEVPPERAGEVPASEQSGYETILIRHELSRAIGQLPPHQRETLNHVHVHGRSVRETSRLLGVPEGTVKSRTHYAVHALRTVLAERGLDAALALA